MSNYKMVDVEKSISIQHEQFTRFKTAYDYLNKQDNPSNNELSSPILDVTHRIFFSLFNKEIEITENNTNDRLKLRMRERSDDDIHDTTIKKHYSLSMEDLITITGR